MKRRRARARAEDAQLLRGRVGGRVVVQLDEPREVVRDDLRKRAVRAKGEGDNTFTHNVRLARLGR